MSEGEALTEELAEDRTDLAEDRTVLATERTFAGWMRTAFGAIGIGLGFQGLFGKLDPPWLARVIATVFILLGAMIAITAERRACKGLKRMTVHRIDGVEAPRLRWIAYSIAFGALALIAAFWFQV
jgi:putative membrane protein